MAGRDGDAISESDVAAAVGPVDGIILHEMLRTGASALELHCALSFAAGPRNADAGAYRGLPQRVQRLVDLITVALAGRAAALAMDERGATHRAA